MCDLQDYRALACVELRFRQCRTRASDAFPSHSGSLRRRSSSHVAKYFLPFDGGCPSGFNNFAATSLETSPGLNPRNQAASSTVKRAGSRTNCSKFVRSWLNLPPGRLFLGVKVLQRESIPLAVHRHPACGRLIRRSCSSTASTGGSATPAQMRIQSQIDKLYQTVFF